MPRDSLLPGHYLSLYATRLIVNWSLSITIYHETHCYLVIIYHYMPRDSWLTGHYLSVNALRLTSASSCLADSLQFAVEVVSANKRHVTKRHSVIPNMTDMSQVVLWSTNHVRLQPTTRTQWQPCRLCDTHECTYALYWYAKALMDVYVLTQP